MPLPDRLAPDDIGEMYNLWEPEKAGTQTINRRIRDAIGADWSAEPG